MPFQVTCPSCDSKLQVPDTAAGKNIACPKCGASFSAQSPSTPSPAGASKATKPCPHCGKEVLAAARKCKHCHQMLDADSPRSTEPEQDDERERQRQANSKTLKMVALAIGIPVLLFLLCCGCCNITGPLGNYIEKQQK